jgi:hypothetical protein
MRYIKDSRCWRFQFSIRFLLGLTAGVAATCAFGASAGWDRLLFVAMWYGLLAGYMLTAIITWWVLQGARAPQPRFFTGSLVAKLVAGSFVFGWLLFLLLVGLFSHGA